ncbi:hypothetical protein, conserved [Leishmania tarentolae]|uniref:Uncharacterized protein n=1 Tax=Leishmania tarentolae TaxID=5689 RepID=A0A640KK18_LEITA|nr:hypothetical protein, conserved [Leishmania tarentolae]
MWQLHIPTSLPAAPINDGVSILVGQRSCVSSSANEATYTVCVLAGYVQCDDPSVAEEQIESLENVLPFGIEVLGFSGDATALTSLAAALLDLKRKELIEVVVPNRKRHFPPACRMFGEPAKKVEVVESKIAFVEARCALHTYNSTLPLVIVCSNALPQVVDGESHTPLTGSSPSSSSKIELIQTGAVSRTLRIHVVMAPSLMSASGLYKTLFRQLKAAWTSRTMRLIELNSHNAHLSYCCRLECDTDTLDSTDTVTEDDWAVVLEMMEDATGQRVSRSDVCGIKPISEPCGRSEASTAAATRKLPAQLPHLLLGLIVLIVAVVVLV